MVRMIRLLGFAIRMITPWVVRVVIFTAQMLATSFASWWVGVPTATRRIAQQWMDAALAAEFPSQYDTLLYRLMTFAAFVTIVVAWLVSAFVTVWLIRVIF